MLLAWLEIHLCTLRASQLGMPFVLLASYPFKGNSMRCVADVTALGKLCATVQSVQLDAASFMIAIQGGGYALQTSTLDECIRQGSKRPFLTVMACNRLLLAQWTPFPLDDFVWEAGWKGSSFVHTWVLDRWSISWFLFSCWLASCSTWPSSLIITTITMTAMQLWQDF